MGQLEILNLLERTKLMMSANDIAKHFPSNCQSSVLTCLTRLRRSRMVGFKSDGKKFIYFAKEEKLDGKIFKKVLS